MGFHIWRNGNSNRTYAGRNGLQSETRFAKFYNLPELMAMFKEVADIKTADMLNLPVPEAEYHNVSVEPSEMQKEMVASLAERAEKVRGGGVDSSVDNMLKSQTMEENLHLTSVC